MNLIIKGLIPLLMVSCASCKVVKDLAQSPAELDQNREIIKINDLVEAGIHGTIDVTKPIYLRSYGKGTVTLRGMNDCGFITSGATSKTGWISIDPQIFPDLEFCLFTIHSKTNGFDAPAIGHVLVRRFFDPNVKPLNLEMNHVLRSGVNWVQLKSDSTKTLEEANGGIYENRDIIIHLGGHSGKLNITGCGFHPDVTQYIKQDTMKLTVDYLYREVGNVSKSCVFTITANHDDTLKESATIFVKVYSGVGSFLDAPIVSTDTWGDTCFEFIDPYVVGIGVNGKWKKSRSLCVNKEDFYKVEGVTSKSRIFYGEHNGLDWTVMK